MTTTQPTREAALLRGGRSAVCALARRPRDLGGLALAAILTLSGFALVVHSFWIPAKALVAQELLERAWRQAQTGAVAPRPWPWADTWPVARLDVPRLDAHAVVLAEAGGEAMAFGPAHLTQTPAPGEPGVSVIAAHRDTHFRFLQHLTAGDEIWVERADGARVRFTVTGTDIVRHDRSGIEPEGGAPRLALVTCYPFGAVRPGPLRYVVWAEATRGG